MGSSSTSWTSESNTHAGSSKVFSSSTWDAYVSSDSLRIQAAEGNAGILELWADEGDDNADKWKWQVADGGTMTWQSYTGGSYATMLTLSTGGVLTVGGDLAISGGNITTALTCDSTVAVTGVLSPATHVDMPDSANIKLGTGDDLQVYHDGSNSYITNATGALKLATETSGIAITVGHTTSEVTVADNFTVTGTTTLDGVTTAMSPFKLKSSDGPVSDSALYFRSDDSTDQWRFMCDESLSNTIRFYDDVNDVFTFTMYQSTGTIEILGDLKVTGNDILYNTAGAATLKILASSGTNTAGGALTIAGGQGTGSGAGGSIIFQTADGGGSGSSANALATAMTISDNGDLTVGANTDGHDVKFYGATSGSYMNWDETNNKLELQGASIFRITTDSDAPIKVTSTDSYCGIDLQDSNSTGTFNGPLIAGDNLRFRTLNTDRMTMNATGLGIGTTAPSCPLHIDQSSASGAVTVLKLDQADIDDSFIDFIGTSAADGSRSISSDTTTDSAKFGAIAIEINGVSKWIRIYDTHS